MGSAFAGGAAGRASLGAEQRDHLLVCAAACISEHGLEKTRLRDVASTAGVSIGLIQHYFESRDHLVGEAFVWNCSELIARWQTQARSHPDAPWERILFLIDELTTSPDLDRHASTWLEFCAGAARHPELRGAVTAVFAAWRRIILDAVEEALRRRQIEPELPVGDVADILNALVDGLEMATAVRAGLVSPERFRHLVVTTASALLRPLDSPCRAPAAPAMRRE
ncbi:MAG: TetR/AcrR family transcriptional regulator [Acidimicrobiales bacterium]